MMGLKECPFCGSTQNNIEISPQFNPPISFIKCECGAIVSFAGKEKMPVTINAYNTRAKKED